MGKEDESLEREAEGFITAWHLRSRSTACTRFATLSDNQKVVLVLERLRCKGVSVDLRAHKKFCARSKIFFILRYQIKKILLPISK